MSVVSDINLVAQYLARRDVAGLRPDALGGSVDVLVLLASSLLEPIEMAAQALKNGSARRLLISGGIGHSTDDLRRSVAAHSIYRQVETMGRSEAEICADILIQYLDIDPDLILVESASTNCGGNAVESRRVLDGRGETVRTMLLMQDPTMQRRTHACFERAWSDHFAIRIMSYAPFVPRVELEGARFVVKGSGGSTWGFGRFVSLILGEIPRLRDDASGYGPNGRDYFDHVEVPILVLEAYECLCVEFADLIRTMPA
jgi:hypothetical protein